jgi:hypothetical protein
MPGEYGLKKDRDRQFFTGEFLWSGFDDIGEPTPYAQFPVTSSSFGAVDAAGFPKEQRAHGGSQRLVQSISEAGDGSGDPSPRHLHRAPP